jgi:hypothetical protein
MIVKKDYIHDGLGREQGKLAKSSSPGSDSNATTGTMVSDPETILTPSGNVPGWLLSVYTVYNASDIFEIKKIQLILRTIIANSKQNKDAIFDRNHIFKQIDIMLKILANIPPKTYDINRIETLLWDIKINENIFSHFFNRYDNKKLIHLFYIIQLMLNNISIDSKIYNINSDKYNADDLFYIKQIQIILLTIIIKQKNVSYLINKSVNILNGISTDSDDMRIIRQLIYKIHYKNTKYSIEYVMYYVNLIHKILHNISSSDKILHNISSSDKILHNISSSDKFHTGDSDKFHTADSDKFHTGDSDKFHTADSDKFHTADSDKFHTADSDKFHTADSDKFHTADSDKFHTPDNGTKKSMKSEHRRCKNGTKKSIKSGHRRCKNGTKKSIKSGHRRCVPNSGSKQQDIPNSGSKQQNIPNSGYTPLDNERRCKNGTKKSMKSGHRRCVPK